MKPPLNSATDGEEETAELATTASFDKLRMSAQGEPVEPGVLRGSFRLGIS
jgi:hypothetical protein